MTSTTDNRVLVSITDDCDILVNGLLKGKNSNDFITEECDEIKPDADKYGDAVVKALKLGDNRILLGITWATEESRIHHTCFPNILRVDVTHSTNKECCLHLRVIGKHM